MSTSTHGVVVRGMSLLSLGNCRSNPLGDLLHAASIVRQAVCNGLGVGNESLPVQVLEVIALLVIVGVVPLAGGTTIVGGFLLSLNTLGTGEDTTGGNANLEEGAIVRAAREFGWGRLAANGVIEVIEDLLNLSGAGRCRSSLVECRSITIVNFYQLVQIPFLTRN